MKTEKKRLQRLLDILVQNNILMSITGEPVFYDEPKVYMYSSIIQYPLVRDRRSGKFATVTGGGGSFYNKELALIRCIGESIERRYLYQYPNKIEVVGSYNKIVKRHRALDPMLYTDNQEIRNSEFAWINGHNLTQEYQCLIPAQLAYLNHQHFTNETPLTSYLSSGAAGGFDKHSSLLRGIYETIEVDVRLTSYLCMAKVPKIDPGSIRSDKVQKAVDYCRRYELEPIIFDITCDIGVPSFMTVFLDTSGIGPPVCIGTKSNLSTENAILESIEEACISRPWLRLNIYKHNLRLVPPEKIKSKLDRAIYWMQPKMLQTLNYLIRQPFTPLNNKPLKNHGTNELQSVIEILNKKSFEVYYVDLTQNTPFEGDYIVTKSIIPGLQMLYFDEQKRIIKYNRLDSVAKYFNISEVHLNPIPHPFL